MSANRTIVFFCANPMEYCALLLYGEMARERAGASERIDRAGSGK